MYLPAYLKSLVQQPTTNETSSYTQEASTPPTSLHGPVTLPVGPSQTLPSIPPPGYSCPRHLDLHTPHSSSSHSQSFVPPPSRVGSSRPQPFDALNMLSIPSQSHSFVPPPPPVGTADIPESSASARGSTHSSSTTCRHLGPRRKSASNDAHRDANNKYTVVLSPDYKIIDNHIASLITCIFQQFPQAVAWQYKMIPDAILQKYWEEFKKDCAWNPSTYSEEIMKKAFLKKLKERYGGILNNMRKSNKMPPWCPKDVWDAWWRMWDTNELASKIRIGQSGVAKGTHPGGSVSHAKTAAKLERKRAW